MVVTRTIERQERALNISKKTKQVKVIVVSLGVIILSSICMWSVCVCVCVCACGGKKKMS